MQRLDVNGDANTVNLDIFAQSNAGEAAPRESVLAAVNRFAHDLGSKSSCRWCRARRRSEVGRLDSFHRSQTSFDLIVASISSILQQSSRHFA
jgi:hypothetical protein